MDINSSDEHHSSVDSTLSQTEINEATLSDRTEPSMFAHAISLDLLPSSGQQEWDVDSFGEGWECLGARPRDRQRQQSLPGPSTTAPLPPQQSETLAGDLKANYLQSGSIHEAFFRDNEDDHGPQHTQMQLPLARPLPSPLPQQDGLADNFIMKHSCDITILEDLHMGTQMQNTQALPPPSVLHVIGPEASEGLQVNIVARHCQNDSILEDLQQQIAVAEEQPVAETCGHYKRKCFAWFPCCKQFWPCHHCHNLSRECCESEASNATQLKCSKCHSVQEIKNGPTCQNCQIKMAAYFCRICKLLSNVHVDKEPYHCEKCGVCRTYRTKSFHCDMCGICMNIRCKDNHECRPSSAHDACCICLEDTFSGCHVLPCSHKMHNKCFFKMRVLSNLDTCPICRQPISRSQRE